MSLDPLEALEMLYQVFSVGSWYFVSISVAIQISASIEQDHDCSLHLQVFEIRLNAYVVNHGKCVSSRHHPYLILICGLF